MDKPAAKPAKSKRAFKRRALIIGVALVVVYALYCMLIRVTNETGWLGADKYGRQVLIQTLDDYAKDDGLHITSDYSDHSVWGRLLVQEPMRTVIKYEVKKSNDGSGLKKQLAQSYRTVTGIYTDKITLREDLSQSVTDVTKNLQQHKAKTLADLYAGFGFRRVEFYVNGKLVESVNITTTQNKQTHGIL